MFSYSNWLYDKLFDVSPIAEIEDRAEAEQFELVPVKNLPDSYFPDVGEF